jgi:peptidyl-prolyl cis-trans isomerase C
MNFDRQFISQISLKSLKGENNMQQKVRNCLFTVIATFVVICWGAMTLAAESTTTNKSTTPATTPATKSAVTPANTTTTKSSTAPAGAATTKSATTSPGKVASVNGTAINQDQFDRSLAYQQEIAALQGVTITDDQMPQLKYEILQNLISTELLYQESQKSGIKIEETEINETYEAQKQKANFKTDAEFEAALKQSNKTMASYRAEIKQGLAIDRFVKSKFTDKTTISDSEAKKYYDDNPGYFQQPAQVRISHIMIRVDSKADQSKKDEAKKKIEQVLNRLKAGEDFAALAKEVSEDTNSKNNGGDLDYISKGQAPQSFEDAAFALKKGEISNIVTSDSGYHIIKVTDKQDAKKIGYEESKNDIITGLKSSKVNSAVNQYVIVLKNKSTIQTLPISK